MLRIIAHPETDKRIRLQLAGRIGPEEIELLDGELRRLQHPGTQLVLDLAGIQFIDPAGLELLERWLAAGLQLCGGSVFIRRALAASGLQHQVDLP